MNNGIEMNQLMLTFETGDTSYELEINPWMANHKK